MRTRYVLIGTGVLAALVFVSGTSQAQEGRWAATSLVAAPSARALQTAVWTGSRMVIWGGDGPGLLNTGAAYDPATDTWTSTSVANAPGARDGHTAVWTGSRMIVWGGDGGTSYLNTGAAYDATTDTWTPISTADAPSARYGHTAVWTGSRMIVWGGYGAAYLNTGAAYDPVTDTWTPLSTADAPSGRFGHTAIWTGSRMIVWGGGRGGPSQGDSTGGVYDLTTDSWTPTSSTGEPTAPGAHTAVWTRSRMIVWGGENQSGSQNTGAAYDPRTDTWTATSTADAPGPRSGHTAVWTGLGMIVWGGSNGTAPLNSGGTYDPLFPRSYYTVTPCRLVDTRQPAGPLGGPALAANRNREFVVAGHCGIPPTAQAISINLTAIGETAEGHLRLYPGGTAPPATSSLNYAAGKTRANNAIVTLGAEGNVGVRCVQGSGTADVVIDVSGYFE